MRLRAATGQDVPAVHALEVLAFGVDAWSVDSVREELTSPTRTAVVACDPDVVGYAVTSVAGGPSDPVDLQRIAVHPERRRCGLARDLLAAVDSGGRMLLEVAAGNAGALAFYAGEGFTEIARRRRYYRDGSDAVVMERAAPR